MNTTTNHPSTSTRDVAVRALRERGIDAPEALVEFAAYENVIGACDWYDTQRGNVTPGLLVWKVKQGGVEPRGRNETTTRVRPRIVYDESCLPLFYLSHRDWELSRKFDTDCAGRLMIIEAEYPVLTVECDECGFQCGMPHRGIPARLREPLGLDQRQEAA